MVLLNKAALSSFDFNAPMSLLFFQCVVCVILVQLYSAFGYIKIEPMNKAIVKLWFPVNLIFVGMIFTSFFALKFLGVPMVTVLKNLTNLFTICGDYLLYRKVMFLILFMLENTSMRYGPFQHLGIISYYQEGIQIMAFCCTEVLVIGDQIGAHFILSVPIQLPQSIDHPP